MLTFCCRLQHESRFHRSAHAHLGPKTCRCGRWPERRAAPAASARYTSGTATSSAPVRPRDPTAPASGTADLQWHCTERRRHGPAPTAYCLTSVQNSTRTEGHTSSRAAAVTSIVDIETLKYYQKAGPQTALALLAAPHSLEHARACSCAVIYAIEHRHEVMACTFHTRVHMFMRARCCTRMKALTLGRSADANIRGLKHTLNVYDMMPPSIHEGPLRYRSFNLTCSNSPFVPKLPRR
jgi:hypothetical protein